MKKHFLFIIFSVFIHFHKLFRIHFLLESTTGCTSFIFKRKYKVGVKTIKVHNPRQIDIINSNKEQTVLYDRPLTLEIWYPALLENDIKEEVVYNQMMGNFSDPKRPLIPFKFKEGRQEMQNLIDLTNPIL